MPVDADRDPATLRVAVVTGGAGAMGSAIAARLAADDVRVVLADLDEAVATTVAARHTVHGAPALAFRVDMTAPDSIRDLVEVVTNTCGRLDIVVNNAGRNDKKPLAEVSVDEWDDVLDTNLRGPMLLVQAALPLLRQAEHGRVVNIASRVWLAGGNPAYAASKAGLVGLTRSMATTLAPLGVTANAVAPSFVETAFTRSGRDERSYRELADRARALTPLRRLAEPDDVAHAVAFLASPQARHITGEVLHVCGGAQLAAL